MRASSGRLILLISTAAMMCRAQSTVKPPDWFSSVHADLAGFRYAPLARQARISGTVRLTVDPATSEITVDSGHRLLVESAKANLAKWKFDTSAGEAITVEYVFRLGENTCTYKNVSRSSSVGRFFLRAFGQPTSKTVSDCRWTTPNLEGPFVPLSGERKITIFVNGEPAQLNYEAAKVTD